MSLWAAGLALLGVLLATFGPGAATLAVAGLRGLALLALAPAVSTALLAGAALLGGLVGVPWSWPTALGGTVVAVGVAYLLRRWWGAPGALRLPGAGRTGLVVTWAAGAGAALLAALPMRAGMGGVRSVPHTADAPIHHDLLRFVVETGNGSVLTLVRLPDGDDGLRVIRPSGWHDVVSTAMSLTGTDAVVAANVSALVLAGLVVPLGIGYAAAALVPGWRWAAAAGFLAGTGFVSLPTIVVSFGTLWPFAWAAGLVPAVLGALVLLLRDPGPRRTGLVVWAVSVAGIAVANRVPVLSLGFLALPLLLAAAGTRWRRLVRAAAGRRAGLEAAGAVVAAGSLLLVDVLLTSDRPPGAPRTMSSAQATGEGLLDTPLSEQPFGVVPPAWLLGALVLAGALLALRTAGMRAWVVSWGLAVALYAIAATAPPEYAIRRAVTSWWFDDPLRVSTMIPVVAAPLVVVALAGLHDAVAARPWARTTVRPDVVVGVVSLVAVALLSLERADVRRDRMWLDYAPLPPATSTPADGANGDGAG